MTRTADAQKKLISYLAGVKRFDAPLTGRGASIDTSY